MTECVNEECVNVLESRGSRGEEWGSRRWWGGGAPSLVQPQQPLEVRKVAGFNGPADKHRVSTGNPWVE